MSSSLSGDKRKSKSKSPSPKPENRPPPPGAPPPKAPNNSNKSPTPNSKLNKTGINNISKEKMNTNLNNSKSISSSFVPSQSHPLQLNNKNTTPSKTHHNINNAKPISPITVPSQLHPIQQKPSNNKVDQVPAFHKFGYILLGRKQKEINGMVI